MPVRLDRASYRKPKKLPNGYLRADAVLTRVGVFEYRRADGTIRRELRLPEEVFSQDSLASFSMMPVTDEHPPVALDAENTHEFQVGVVGENPRADGDHVISTVMVTDAKVVAAVEKGAKRELSCGYNCKLDETPGEWNGQRYDAIQRQIRGNHVALVTKGRAGPEACLRMDSEAAIMADDEAADPGEEGRDDGNADQPRDEHGMWTSSGGGPGKLGRVAEKHLGHSISRATRSQPGATKDFQKHAVWEVKSALHEAYTAGSGGIAPSSKELEGISTKHLGHDLRTRNSDNHDFHEHSNEELRGAMEAAHERGRAEAKRKFYATQRGDPKLAPIPKRRRALDSADLTDTDDSPTSAREGQQERQDMKKVLINGIWVEVSEQAEQALTVERQRNDEALKAATAKADKEAARADGMKEQLEKAESARKDAADPSKLRAAVAARVALEKDAAAVLGDETKLDALSDEQVKAEMLKKLCPSLKLDGKSSDYVQARLDGALEAFRADQEDEADAALATVRKAATGRVTKQDNEDSEDEVATADEAAAKWAEESRNAWKQLGKRS